MAGERASKSNFFRIRTSRFLADAPRRAPQPRRREARGAASSPRRTTGEHLRRAWERGAREPAEPAELAFLHSKSCASTSCWFARCWASAARGCRGGRPAPPDGARRGAGARAAAGAEAREGHVGAEERHVPETRQCGYRATPRYHAKTSNHPSPPHRRAACRRRCRRAGALMQR